MSWLSELFFGQGVAHSVLMFAIVIALGIVFGKVKVWGISLGITWILFVCALHMQDTPRKLFK